MLFNVLIGVAVITGCSDAYFPMVFYAVHCVYTSCEPVFFQPCLVLLLPLWCLIDSLHYEHLSKDDDNFCIGCAWSSSLSL